MVYGPHIDRDAWSIEHVPWPMEYVPWTVERSSVGDRARSMECRTCCTGHRTSEHVLRIEENAPLTIEHVLQSNDFVLCSMEHALWITEPVLRSIKNV